MTTNITPRWAIIRSSTGRIVRGFTSREDARNYKRNNTGNLAIFDRINAQVVR